MTRTAAFTLRAALVVAAGISVPTTLFSIVRVAILADLPCPEADRLGLLFRHLQHGPSERGGISPPNLIDLWTNTRGFDSVGAIATGSGSVQFADGSESVTTAYVSPGTLPLLGVRPVLGRLLLDSDLRSGEPDTVVISERLWHSRFGARNPVGMVLRLGRPATIVGVVPAIPILPLVFRGAPDLFLPVFHPNEDRESDGRPALVRLRRGVSWQDARAAVEREGRRLRSAYPDDNRDFRPAILPLRNAILGGTEKVIWGLFLATALLWCLASVNFAALVGVRMQEKQVDFAIRQALGATRKHLAVSIIKEVARPAVLGAGIGLLLATAGCDLLRRNADLFEIPRLDQIRLGMVPLLFALLLTALSGLFAVLPALRRTLRTDTQALLHSGSSRISGRGRAAEAIVAAQFCLAMVLACLAGNTARSLVHLERRALGYDPRDLATTTVWLPYPSPTFDQDARRRDAATFKSIIDYAGRLPGAKAATAIYPPLGTGEFLEEFYIYDIGVGGSARPSLAAKRAVHANYFQAMGIPLLRGRLFLPQEDFFSDVVLVNQAFVRRYLASREPIGVRLYWKIFGPEKQLRIIGVTGDSLDRSSRSF